ncbi:hypothetical protein TNCV_3375681 [Trichonephila clavipes]|nr:hypothetical protein TNCV_3375681 [Trichonephila clavipes]
MPWQHDGSSGEPEDESLDHVDYRQRLTEKEALDRSENVEDSFGHFNSFIREDKIFCVFWADLGKPELNC